MRIGLYLLERILGQGTIFLVSKDGELARMQPSAPATEDRMQELVGKYPELISDGGEELLLIRREQPIADASEGGGRWALDHLFVTKGAVPVLVELKRASDTRLRREVVGQMLDYAANAVAYWKPGQTEAAFAESCQKSGKDPQQVLSKFIGDRLPSEFWTDVDKNVQTGQMKLVFVADVIPRELAKIVEFLNSQMTADVRAVELKWFEGGDGVTTLVPRVIGETELTASRKSSSRALGEVSVEEWIGHYIAPRGQDAVKGTWNYIAAIEELGGRVSVASQHGSIFAEFVGDDGKQFYPFHLWKDSLAISLSFKWLWRRQGLSDPSTRQEFMREFERGIGTLSTSNDKGFPSFPAKLLADGAKKQLFQDVAKKFVEVARVA